MITFLQIITTLSIFAYAIVAGMSIAQDKNAGRAFLILAGFLVLVWFAYPALKLSLL